ncbi:MAG: hypothetical protein GY861_11570 [bacterium]|nr:hypothetical protein [bacterium]
MNSVSLATDLGWIVSNRSVLDNSHSRNLIKLCTYIVNGIYHVEMIGGRNPMDSIPDIQPTKYSTKGRITTENFYTASFKSRSHIMMRIAIYIGDMCRDVNISQFSTLE